MIRRLFKDAMIYGSSTVLLRATAFLTVPIYTRFFTPSDYGTWSFVATSVWFLNGFLLLGGDTAYTRLFFEEKTLEARRLLTSTVFGFLAVWSVAVVAVLVPFGHEFSVWSFGTSRYTSMFWLALLAAPLILMNALAGQAMRNTFRVKAATILNVAAAVVEIGSSLVLLLVADLGIRAPLAGMLIGAAVLLPVRVWFIRDFLRPVFSASLLKRALAFGVPLVPATVSTWVVLSSDRLILAKLGSPRELGLYTVAVGAASVLMLADSAFGQAWMPHAIRVHEEERVDAPTFYGRVLTYILVAFGAGAVLLTLSAKEILVVLARPEYYAAAYAVGPLALGGMAYAAARVTAIGAVLGRRTVALTVIAAAAALLNVGLNFVLVPPYGFVGSAVATAVTYGFIAVAQFVLSQRVYPVIRVEARRVVGIVLCTTGCVAAGSLVLKLHTTYALPLRFLLAVAYVVALFVVGAVDQRELRVGRRVLDRFLFWRVSA